MANCGVVKGPAWHQQRLRCLTALVVGVAIMGACAPLSVAPVVGEGQATDVPGLAGRWVGEDGDTTV
ncbi:MAG: hypothetical protein FIB01_09475, partial [Gemmatimonadetes bacterium]|nr:hypothetical protein [Gemmatimonadota bacterium]